MRILEFEAKGAMEEGGTSGLFNVSALKFLRCKFGNTSLVAHRRLKNLVVLQESGKT